MKALQIPNVLLIMAISPAVMAHVKEENYSSQKEAIGSVAKADGFIPDWLPVAAADIHFARNAHNTDFLLRFRLPQGEALNLPSGCQATTSASAGKSPFKRTWWPNDLPQATPATVKYKYFACGTNTVAVVLEDGTQVFVWRSQ